MKSRFKYVVISSSTVLVAMLLLGGMMGRSASPEDTYRRLQVFTEVLAKIKGDYVEEPNMQTVTLGALNGLLESIDPYASYLSADQYKQYLKNRDSNRPNVGLILARRFGYLSIVSAIPGSPAAKAGLATGDMIETINGVSTRDMPLAYADIMFQGDAGSTVEISALRFRKPEPQKITLTRAAIVLPAVASKMLDGNIGYVQAQSLDSGKVKDVARAVESLEKQGAQKLVLDLRTCSSGQPEDGITLANLFMDKGEIGYLQGQKVSKKVFTADPAKTIFRKPMVVLINRGTATAAEVAAAALLDSKRAEVVGERTYGDASLRKAITMEDGAAVILSVAKYYPPTGKAIQDTGVTPSVPQAELEPTADDDDDTAAADAEKKKAGEDPVLKKGLEILIKGKPETKQAAGSQKKEDSTPVMNPLNIPKPRQ
jgi:carboxyl-terminal processing protease